MTRTRRTLHSIALLIGIAAAPLAIADEPNKLIFLEGKEKSTLETFPLKSLEQDDLSAAVIGGTLAATAAGKDEEPPKVMNLLPREMYPGEENLDLRHSDFSVQIETRPQPVAVEGRTYGWDYSTQQR